MVRRLMQGPEKRTHPVVWCVAVVCTVIAVAVILTGLVVFVAYLVIQPRVPVVSVAGARLDRIQNDMAGVLEVHLRLVMRAENDNMRAHASFSDTKFELGFQGIPVATLKASAFDVPKNDTFDLPYTVVSNFIPLTPSQAEDVGLAIKEDQITFELKGHSRARWRVGLIGSVKFWCNLNCRLNFHPMNGSFINSKPCTSRAK